MRRTSVLLFTTTLLAGGAAMTALAQDASGPSTSGGSLPYISGQDAAKNPDAQRPPAAKTQATSGAPGSTAPAPPRVPGPLSAEKPVEPAPGEKPADEVRKIEITRDRAKPTVDTAASPNPPAPKPPSEPPRDTVKSEPQGDRPVETGDAEETKPTRRATPPVERKKPAVAETKRVPKPRGEVVTRDPSPRDGRVVGVAPVPRSYGSVDEDDFGERRVVRPYEGRTIDPRADRNYVLRDSRPPQEDEMVVMPQRRWSERFVYSYPYYRPGAPVLRSYEPQPYAYYRAAPGAGDGCHFHAYPPEDGRFHRNIRCHWHEEHDDPGIRSVR